jgi:rhamnosyltransferase
MPEARASVIVRTKNEARAVERAFAALRAQTVSVEIVVVDSGSSDGTLEIARAWCDELVEIPPERFTYGRALNVGAERANAPFHFALSAHCAPARADWVERSLAHYERGDVAATNGIETFPDGTPVARVFYQDAAHARANPYWGFSNHASSWRGDVWRRFPFDERLEATEDREWSWRVLDAGWVIAFDPGLWVDMSHAWRASSRNVYRRKLRETRALAAFAPLPRYGLREALAEWWSPPDREHSALFHRLNYRRAAGLAGKYRGLAATRRGS